MSYSVKNNFDGYVNFMIDWSPVEPSSPIDFFTYKSSFALTARLLKLFSAFDNIFLDLI
jgi:hypothetical protein